MSELMTSTHFMPSDAYRHVTTVCGHVYRGPLLSVVGPEVTAATRHAALAAAR
jgi:hypothetical protein